MAWIHLKFDVDANHADGVADALQDLGAEAVTFEDAADQPVFEPDPGEVRLWRTTRVVGLFDAAVDVEALIPAITEAVGAEAIHQHVIEPVPDKDWVRASLEHFKPLRCGERLWICPTWHTPPDPAAVNVMLNPGLAFGTGGHATTAQCLEWLDAHPPTGQSVLDFGCGSGILAIAAVLLGASRVDVVDHDPQAIEATQSNAAMNGAAEKIHVTDAPRLGASSYDLILANILAEPLIQLAPRFAAWLKPGGKVVLSGILGEQGQSVVAAYQPWFTILTTSERENWLLISASRNA